MTSCIPSFNVNAKGISRADQWRSTYGLTVKIGFWIEVPITKPKLLLIVLVVPEANSEHILETFSETLACKVASGEKCAGEISGNATWIASTTLVIIDWTAGATTPLRKIAFRTALRVSIDWVIFFLVSEDLRSNVASTTSPSSFVEQMTSLLTLNTSSPSYPRARFFPFFDLAPLTLVSVSRETSACVAKRFVINGKTARVRREWIRGS